jgi:hypothetical protein
MHELPYRETPMLRAFRRGGWALAAAAGLGLGLPPRALPAGPGISSSEIISEIDATTLGPDMVQQPVVPAQQTRIMEMEIELAWLADPLTFPYHLAARVQGSAVHVRGFVQNKAAHDKALRIARERGALPVVDELKIHPKMLIGGMVPAEAPRAAEAEAALKGTFPGRAAALHVACRPDGQVTVTGTIASLEEKVAASRHLRALPGCAAVINQLQLSASPDPRAMQHADVNRDETLPAETSEETPGQPGKTAESEHISTEETPHPPQPPEPWVPVTPAPTVNVQPTAPASSAPPGAPSAAKGSRLVPNTDLLTRLKTRIESVCGKGALDIRLVPESRRNLRVELTVPDDDTAALLSEKILSLPELAAYHVDLDVKVPEPAAAPPRGSKAPGTSQAPPPPPVPAAKTNPAPAVSVAPQPPAASPPVGPPAPEPHAALPAPLPPPPPVAPPPAPVAMTLPESPKVTLPAAPPPVPELPKPPTVFATMTKTPSNPTPGPIIPQEALPKSSPVMNTLPKETTKTTPVAEPGKLPTLEKAKPPEGITFRMPQFRNGDTPASTAAPSQPTPSGSAHLKECIERACGRTASDVLVQVHSPANVRVQFKAPDEKEGERLAAKVMAMPELSAYHVDLDVSVADEPVPPAIVQVAWHPASMPTSIAQAASKAAPVSPSAPVQKPAAAAPSRPAEARPAADNGTAGVVVITEPASTPSNSASTLPLGLEQDLQAICGSRAELHVLPRSTTHLLVQFKARDAAEAERLTNVLLNRPELRPFKVDVDVTLLP